MFDLIIIGGGPAGSAAAIVAARGGARVLVLERGRFPRHKVCGEFVSHEGLSLLENLGLGDLAADASRIARARIVADLEVVEFPIAPDAASISRYDLDYALWRQAQNSGVDCRAQVEVKKIRGSGAFLLDTSAGTFAAAAVINASGRWSNLRRNRLTLPERQRWVGWKAHFLEPQTATSVDLYFVHGGYCGVQPLGGGRVNACAMARQAGSLAEVLSLHPALWQRSRRWEQVSEAVATAPLVFGAAQPEEDGVLFVGDAAGFIDPFVGDGISLALRSGTMAAEALVNFRAGKCSLPEAAAAYRRRYQRELRPLFRNAGWLRRLTSTPQALRRPLMAVLRIPQVTRFLVRKTRARA